MLFSLIAGAALAAPNLVKEAAGGFVVPSFSAQQLLIEGDDLFAVSGDETGPTAIDGQLALIYTRSGQDPTTSYAFGNALGTYLTVTPGVALGVAAEDTAAGTYTRYLTGPRGLFLNGHGALGVARVAEQDPALDTTAGVGIGYGRVVDARTVAQAAKMYEILGRTPTVDDLRRVAEILGQRSAYTTNYRFDADMFFYRDVSAAIGPDIVIEDVYKLQQVLDSPLYNIGSRYTGWQFSAGADTAYGNVLSPDQGATVLVGANALFGVIVGQNSLLIPLSVACKVVDESVQTLTTPLPGALCSEGINLSGDAAFSMDHTASWNTVVFGGASVTMGTSDAFAMGADAGVETKLALGSKLVWSAKAGTAYSFKDEVAGLEWSASSKITYFVF